MIHRQYSIAIMLLYFICFLISLVYATPEGTDVFRRTYHQLVGRPCVRILNSKGAFGCSSKRIGNTGPLRLINDTASLERMSSYGEFVAVVPADMFTQFTLTRLLRVDNVRGVYSLGNKDMKGPTDSPSAFSPLPILPWSEVDFNAKAGYNWLPLASGAQSRVFPFPMVSLSGDDANHVLKIATDNEEQLKASETPKYHSKLDYFMSASSKDTAASCLRNRTCMPLGGYSAWSTFGNITTHPGRWVLSVVPIDSFSLFSGRATAARHVAAPLTTWMMSVEALRDHLWLNTTADATEDSKNTLDVPLLLLAVNSEQWSRAGSRAFARDIKTRDSFSCNTRGSSPRSCLDPFRVDTSFLNISRSISTVVELGPLSSKHVYMHTQRTPSARELTQTLESISSNVPNDNLVNITYHHPDSSTPGIPPSATHAFLKEFDSQMAAVYLGDFDLTFDDKISSQFDTVSNAGSDRGYNHLCALATDHARLLAFKMGVKEHALASIQVDCSLSATYMKCFTEDLACEAFKKFSPNSISRQFSPAHPPSYYSGVYQPAFAHQIAGLPRLLFDFLQHASHTLHTRSFPPKKKSDKDKDDKDKDDKDNDDKDAPVRVQQWAHFHDALAPEIRFDVANDIFRVVPETDKSAQRGLVWTESNWDRTGSVVYAVEDRNVEVYSLVAGLVATALSLAAGLYFYPLIKHMYR